MIPPFTTAHRRRGGRGALLVSVALLAALAANCEKVPLLAPSNSTISLSASPDTVPLGGTATITAMVLESGGTPVHNGTLVTFTTNLGTLNPPDNTTVNGRATTTLRAGNVSGTATVGAMSGSAVATGSGGSGSTGTTSGSGVQVVIGGAAADRVVLSVSPSTVPASGGVVTVTATVVDPVGNPLAGVPVAFSATNGTFDSATEITNGSGQARVQLTTNRDTTVTANAGGKTATADIKVSAAPVVTISANPNTGIYTGTTVVFTVNVTVGTNSFPVQSVSIEYGDGSSSSLGAVTGQVSVSHIYSRSGTFTVTVTARDSSGQQASASTIIVVQARPPVTFSLTASSTSPKVNDVVTFTIGSLPSTATLDHVDWDFGDGTSARASSLTVTHVYTSTGRKVIKATVSTVEGGSGSAQTEVVVQAAS